MPNWLGYGFQESSSFFMNHIIFLHDHVMTILILVIFFISYMIFFLIFNSNYYKFFLEGSYMETIWSLVPTFLLLVVIFPSLKVVYMMEDIYSVFYTVKVVAHQWYWTYVMPFYNNVLFNTNTSSNFYSLSVDSLMDNSQSEEVTGGPRLLHCSDDLMLPVNFFTRFLITSADVIHSFSIPSLGVKVDAVPGRVNQLFVIPTRLGVFYGQCSEICGTNHSFMPISLKVVPMDLFDSYLLGLSCSEVLLDNDMLVRLNS